MNTYLDSLYGARLLGETFPVFWPNLSAVVYNLFLGQAADFDDVTAWTHPCVDDLERLPPLKVQWDGEYLRAVESLTARACRRPRAASSSATRTCTRASTVRPACAARSACASTWSPTRKASGG